MDISQKYYAKWKEPDTRTTYYESINRKFLQKENL